ncbi:LNS2-domain-containing protein [Auriscalpium vulgare]|uniref:LNS2-domain-containing protein n=1 Tax=Auriscalpium vulgare TaxID=40419 RepID=A0ACB8RBA2_9AGAM|nr:LNS2-domain-containing protein [Auriscalpium vulgare]
MNYLWGAVNAISAPYQYYKELPPINPATLTGAIDVIVVRKLAPDGGTELACSPFHVRFGKWQVLRPGEKKVNVSVNGKPSPFHMKIGEAGEAFFLFETEGDVPDDLITSPLLEATKPGEPSKSTRESSQEPDFLDLDATASPPSTSRLSGLSLSKPSGPSSSSNQPSDPVFADQGGRFGAREEGDRAPDEPNPPSLLTNPMSLGRAVVGAAVETEKELSERFKDRLEAAHNMTETIAHERPSHRELRLLEEQGDEALPAFEEADLQMPQVVDNGDIMLDMGGYHLQQPRHPSGSRDNTPSRTPSPAPAPALAEPTVQPASPGSSPNRPIPFPSLRAPSAPPQALHPKPLTLSPAPAEYSWEWGAFPQKSPARERFPKPQTLSKASAGLSVAAAFAAEASGADDDAEDADADQTPAAFHRSKSLPPELEEDAAGAGVPLAPTLEDAGELEVRSDGGLELEVRSEGGMDSMDLEDAAAEAARKRRVQERRGSVTDVTTSEARSSWVRWWRRSGGRTQSVDVRARERGGSVSERPTLKGSNTAPSEAELRRASAQDIPVPERDDVNASAPASLPTEDAPLRRERSVSPPRAPEVPGKTKRFAKTLRLTSEQLQSLDLHEGANTITFSLSTTGAVACTARIFLWEHTDMIVVSDIDGTITKSDALGHVFTMIGRDWTHLGVAKLYTDITRNGYKIMYLTSRAIGQADSTRYYLQGIKQNDYQLPEGPVIMSPDRLMASLHREVIMRKPEVFKMACLRDIQRLWGTVSSGPFYAGFGNRITDALSYRSVNIPSSRIFTIDSNGEVKMELLELAGYKSPSVASYIHMTDLVDQMFPPIQHKWETAFTDNNYWKAPVQDFPLPDLTPPSPALSARSDTSNQSTLARLRNFSLRSTSASTRTLTLPAPATSGERRGREMGPGHGAHTHARQLSSIERLGGVLSSFTLSPSRSVSPDASSTRYSVSEEDEEALEDEDEDEDGGEGRGGAQKRRRRRQRRTSMPGSLPGSRGSFSDDSDLEFGAREGEELGEGDSEEVAEHAFDEDLFATGEMQNVPFL